MTITYRTRQDAGGGGGSHRLSITKERWKTGEERNDYRTIKFAGNIEQIRDIFMCSAITIRDRKDHNTEAIADNSLSRERPTRWLRLFKTIDSMHSVTMPEIDKTREDCIVLIQRDEVRSTRGKRKEEKVGT